MEDKNTDFKNYRQLLQKVDAKFSQIQSKYPLSFACRSGCFGCCKAGLTVTNVEAKHIEFWIEQHQTLEEEFSGLTPLELDNSDFCRFLDKDGKCTIYDVRPIVCRSHGAPILVSNESEDQTLDADVCPLNFQDQGLESLGSDDWIRLDTLNTILSAVDQAFDASRAGQRVPLDPVSFVKA